jgi:signal transduction histidine kinase
MTSLPEKFAGHKSIRRELTTILMLISGVSLLVACAAFMFYDSLLVRREMKDSLVGLTQVIAGMNTGTLTFDDPKTARETLGALRDRPGIVSARLYSTNGLFGEYVREGTTPMPALKKAPTEKGFRFEKERLVAYQPIIFKGDLIGGIVVESDLDELNRRLRSYIGIAVVVLIISSAVALILSTALQRLISAPITRLAETMRNISREQNYGLRAETQRDDEIGELTRGFNEMLAQIQERDAELQKGRDQLEKRVAERTSQLERSNRELQDFAYVASHDLQEPLRKVQAFGDRLQEQFAPNLGEEGRDFIGRMQNAAGRMQTLINDLLAFSRVTTKANPFQRVDLAQVAREVISDLEVRIQQTNGRVEVGELPAIEADALQMRQLLQNLVGNALKFHKEGVGPVVKIGARILKPGEKALMGPAMNRETLELTVADNGIGFDEKYLDRIFEVFQRLHGRGVYDGTGIGLAICRKIVERHDGAITARSKPGEGAMFIVTLPTRHAQ